MYQRIYDSAWHHPGVAWLGALILLVWIARSRSGSATAPWPTGFLLAFLVGFGIEIAVDALFTGAFSPVSSALMSTVGIVFVIAGDWRLFALVEHTVDPRPSWIARSLLLAFLVPVLQAAAIKAWPEVFGEPRRIYLAYEALFVLLGLVLRLVILPRRLAQATPAMRAWALGAVTWFVVQYALWVISDVLILAGAEWALLLRIVPNTMYYAGFLLFVARTAPRLG